MRTRRNVLLSGMAAAGLLALARLRLWHPAAAAVEGQFPLSRSDADWRARLTPDQYDILRHEGTERAFSSPLDATFRPGRYDCVGCDQKLFAADTKFDSGTGWPSFFRPLEGAVATQSDGTLGMERTEVHCTRCGGHLGHVFDDGPRPTGLRYCMNGAVLRFVPA